MPFVNEHAADSPVIISTFSGTITMEDFRQWNALVVTTTMTFLHAPFEKLYFILDVRTAHTDFPTIMAQMRENANVQPTPDFDGEGVDILLVGLDAMAKLASEMARLPQFGGFEMPLFRSLEDALAYVTVDQQKLKQRT